MHFKLHQTLNTVLIIFWTLWLLIVLTTDCCDLLIYQGWLASEWPFASNNLGAVIKMTSRYHLSPFTVVSLFVMIILWCGLNLGIFLKAFCYQRDRHQFLKMAGWGYLFLIGLNLCFYIADEIFIFYDFTDGLTSRISLLILCYACLFNEINSTTTLT